MFNEYQQEYMKSLSETDPKNLCYCGWYPLGQCPHCPKDVSAADKLRVRCPDERCLNYPIATDLNGPITHNRYCGIGSSKTTPADKQKQEIET